MVLDYINMSKNNISRSIGDLGKDIMNNPIAISSSLFYRANFGESILSKKGIDAGKSYMQDLLNQKGDVSSYFKLFFKKIN